LQKVFDGLESRPYMPLHRRGDASRFSLQSVANIIGHMSPGIKNRGAIAVRF